MLKLQANRVAITPVFDSDISAGGIYIPDAAKSRCKQGLVKYVGSECTEVKPGDYVFFPGYSGTVFNLEGEGLIIIMKETSVVAIIESNQWNSLDVKGLYFKDRHGEYWTANYEQVQYLMSKTIKENRALFNVKDSGIKINEE